MYISPSAPSYSRYSTHPVKYHIKGGVFVVDKNHEFTQIAGAVQVHCIVFIVAHVNVVPVAHPARRFISALN
jgi:hypothetical protein